MKYYKYLIMEGNAYRVRTFIALQHIILIIWFFIGLFMFVYGEYIKTGIGIVSFTLLILVLMILRPSKFRVCPQDQRIHVDRAKLRKHLVRIPFQISAVLKWTPFIGCVFQ